MRDDVGFRSQQFEQGVEQRRDRMAEQRGQVWRDLPDATVGQFQAW